MKNIKAIIMLTLAILGLLPLMAIELVRVAKGKPTVDEEWHDIYVDSNMNHGQGRKEQ
ncbi:hypothetical protein [Jeotgalibaca porci]|uniref:hypothetical protein n=1 Tax=Jeotgalibaca porci TaxID=1868793 RepID=UPI00359F59C8